MHPFRIAILVFFVGASVANVLAAKEALDRIGPITVAASPLPTNPLLAPPPSPSVAPGQIDFSQLYKKSISGTSDPYAQRARTLADDKAYLREAIIVTIAGVAWFLVRPKAGAG